MMLLKLLRSKCLMWTFGLPELEMISFRISSPGLVLRMARTTSAPEIKSVVVKLLPCRVVLGNVHKLLTGWV